MDLKIILNILVTLLNSNLNEDELSNHMCMLRNMINIFFKNDQELLLEINKKIIPVNNINECKQIYQNMIKIINET